MSKSGFEIFIEPVTEDRPSLKAFKDYMCNHYRVQSVNDINITVQEYAELMTVFEAGWSAKEQMLLDRILGGNK